MKKNLICSFFKEDNSWIKKVKPNIEIYLYNKNKNFSKNLNKKNIQIIDLPNIGRESHSYLYHIINNWNNLADINIFAQGCPFDHCEYFLEIINKNSIQEMNESCNKIYNRNFTDGGYCPFGSLWSYNCIEKFNKFCNCTSPSNQWNFCNISSSIFVIMEKIFPSNIGYKHNTTYFGNYGSNFAVSKKYVKNIELKVYEDLFDLHKYLYGIPWAFEVVFPTIFHKEYKPKQFFVLKNLI